MADLNRVFLVGNLTRDPELRRLPSGMAVTELQMAVNRRYRSRDGKDQEEVCYVGVVVWERQAETCAEYLRKGSPVLIEGRLQYEQWEKDGKKQSRLRVRADRVQFLGNPRGAEFRDGGGGERGPSRSESGGPRERSSEPPPQDEEAPPEDAPAGSESGGDGGMPF